MGTYSVFMEVELCIRVEASEAKEAERYARKWIDCACDDYEMDVSRVNIYPASEED